MVCVVSCLVCGRVVDDLGMICVDFKPTSSFSNGEDSVVSPEPKADDSIVKSVVVSSGGSVIIRVPTDPSGTVELVLVVCSSSFVVVWFVLIKVSVGVSTTILVVSVAELTRLPTDVSGVVSGLVEAVSAVVVGVSVFETKVVKFDSAVVVSKTFGNSGMFSLVTVGFD